MSRRTSAATFVGRLGVEVATRRRAVLENHLSAHPIFLAPRLLFSPRGLPPTCHGRPCLTRADTRHQALRDDRRGGRDRPAHPRRHLLLPALAVALRKILHPAHGCPT